MKKDKNILVILALLLGAFSMTFNSCSEELVKADYDYKHDGTLTLSTLQLDSLVKASDEGVSLYATVNEVGQSELYDLGFVYTEDESFTTYSTVSVKPDTVETALKLATKDYKITQGKTFYFKAFVLTKDGIVFSEKVESINLPITWEDVGVVHVTDYFWMDDKAEADVVIQKFFGENRYRLVDFYRTIELANEVKEADAIPEGKHLVFYLDDDHNAAGLPKGAQDLMISPFLFYYDTEQFPQYCSFTNTANEYTLNFMIAYDGNLRWASTATFEWVEGYPGEIPEPVAVTYKTDFSTEAGRADWVLGKFSGFGEDDDIWFFDMAGAGVPSWGTSIAANYNGVPLKIISPGITPEEGDILSFGAYSGLFTPENATPENAKVKVYIREVGGGLDLNTPIKELDFLEATKVSIPLTDYVDKKIRVIMIVEQGNFLFYHFAVASSDNASLIFK